MGRSKRRKREERERRQHGAEGEIGFSGVEISVPSPFAPAPPAANDRFWRFALAFLIIFVLLWLLAPDKE
ncbi:hypothetical protein [Tumebacillus flagellatus]|uniref:Uncharacterized protein n=1 Tax=Tumebacillus flagellatus TaxID=1157490 RepID=A0A074LQR5_9BACL|nr:hypothetical protein [Tumebacillus flagellatus]KEO83444.1 hypothetical protein EL26_10755 [Tumebacillus flagellatus]